RRKAFHRREKSIWKDFFLSVSDPKRHSMSRFFFRSIYRPFL
ncbi:hypothetical protein CSUI_007464, partial [Cystoisospora suis]